MSSESESGKTGCLAFLNRWNGIVNRRKILTRRDQKGELVQCLTMVDLISLGLGSCSGTGMYVVAGYIAYAVAGPAVIISFLIGGVASIFSGICYAEFGERVPRTTGSAYAYSYVTIGEVVALVTGWNMVLEYMIGTAACAVAISAAIDSLFNHAISHFLTEYTFPVVERSYPDLLGASIVIVMTVFLSSGVKVSVGFNNTLMAINFVVWIFVLGCGAFYAKPELWADGGFMPFGWAGVLKGSATCFYAFIGFDIIATTGEECKNPSKSIPVAIVLSLLGCLTMYITTAAMLTLVIPYTDIDPTSAVVSMFEQVHNLPAKYIVVVGALAGLTVSQFGSMFPMPRIIYAMAQDGLLFQFFGRIHPKTKTPIYATVFAGGVAALLTAFFGLQALIEMVSIGTLLAYSMVSMSVLLLRYRPTKKDDLARCEAEIHSDDTPQPFKDPLTNGVDEKTEYGSGGMAVTPRGGAMAVTPRAGVDALRRRVRERLAIPHIACEETSRAVVRAIAFMTVVEILLASMLAFCDDQLAAHQPAALAFSTIFFLLFVLGVIVIWIYPESRTRLNFNAPFVPLLPCMALLCNVYLILKLSKFTWLRFVVWMTIGFIIYFSYGAKKAGQIRDRIIANNEGIDVSEAAEQEAAEQSEKQKLKG